MKNKKNLIAAVATVAILLVGYFTYEYLMYVSTDNAQVDGHYLMLAAKVGGYVSTVNIREGQKVAKGDVLVEIDARDYENTLRQVAGDMTAVEAKKTDSERTYKRISALYGKGVVAQQQYDMAATAWADAKARWDAVNAQVAQAKLNLENTKIRASSDGFIAKKSVEVGQLAAPGVPLIGFVDAQERWVTANFKETDLDRIKVGAHVKITVDAVEGRSYVGKVESISSATGSTFTLLPPDNATGNFTKVVQRVPVRVHLEDLKDKDLEDLRVGLSADVKISVR